MGGEEDCVCAMRIDGAVEGGGVRGLLFVVVWLSSAFCVGGCAGPGSGDQ